MTASTIEDVQNEVMELREDINILTGKMLKAKRIYLDVSLSVADAAVIRNARELIQRITQDQFGAKRDAVVSDR